MALLGAIFIYLSVVSVFTTPAARALGITPDGVYRHWLLVSLGLALCVCLGVATVTRIPFRPERLGAWCSHAGVIILAAGSIWYVLGKVRGDCVTIREGAWSQIRQFYLADTFAAYAGGGGAALRQTPITGIDRPVTGGSVELNVPLAGCQDGLTARATGYMPHARWGYSWEDNSPNNIPAVMLGVKDGPAEKAVVLSPSLPGFEQAVAAAYIMVYRPNTTAETLKRLTRPGPGPAVHHELALVLTGKEIPPSIVVVRPDGTRWQGRLRDHQSVDVPLAGRNVAVRLIRTFTNAARRCWARPLDPKVKGPNVGPVLRVEAQTGSFRTATYVPFATYEHISPPQLLDLPGNRALWLNFSRARRPLPATIRIMRTEYLTYPASVVPKDYVTDVEISAGGQKRRETIRLNEPVMVGPYQISQGSWTNDRTGRPNAIVLLVATRPGLWVIWLGCTLICLGFPYALYVKPLLLARRRRR